MHWAEVATLATTLFFVMDPLGNIPLFNSILARFDSQRRAKIVAREMVIALAILMFFLFAGTTIMEFLGLSQSSLSISGGILLFIIALKMIFPKPAALEETDETEDPFIVPLAIPLVAGPSTIAILLLTASSAPDQMHDWSMALFLAWATSAILLTASPYMMRVLGTRGLRALERLMGMLLVIMATQLLLNGVREFIGSL
ncbi:MAG: MarC family protein [Pseudomonadales bacterium]